MPIKNYEDIGTSCESSIKKLAPPSKKNLEYPGFLEFPQSLRFIRFRWFVSFLPFIYKITKIKNKTGEEKAIMEYLRIEHLKEFSAEKHIRKKLLGSEKIVAEFVCYEPA